ncbi:UTP--glucose-1-phosphate uridylyltransferase [Paenibacillus sp. J31TS4]|uniref:UTP--glucose-1-phosphate uridylyltransferase n=1 Tax=Paenibacillus sp. J31TS4 TaxID=2807195 RepID=UPI001B0B0C42|nr:UTP--glucose-1-phosphate uridylyltransferase [Paenibacillus sp. J31TS4]GIP39135.1 UTP--glucose-1-phosphate uridylyltransferase [Paenibacillus sp. J31TS4]
MKVKTAIIPAAGWGTRFLPATKAVPKELLPILDKPALQYVVEEAAEAGIEEIIIVIGPNKKAIQAHFTRNSELETVLMHKNLTDATGELDDLLARINLRFVIQEQALGLGHAIACARPLIGGEPFAVMLGDMVGDSRWNATRQLIDAYNELERPIVAVESVPWSEIEKFGIVEGIRVGRRLMEIQSLVEKPAPPAPSNYAMMGRYILEPAIFDILEATPPGRNGEIQLTDSLQTLAGQERIYAYETEGKFYDVGDKLGYLKATVEKSLQHAKLKEEFAQYLFNMDAGLIKSLTREELNSDDEHFSYGSCRVSGIPFSQRTGGGRA